MRNESDKWISFNLRIKIVMIAVLFICEKLAKIISIRSTSMSQWKWDWCFSHARIAHIPLEHRFSRYEINSIESSALCFNNTFLNFRSKAVVKSWRRSARFFSSSPDWGWEETILKDEKSRQGFTDFLGIFRNQNIIEPFE